MSNSSQTIIERFREECVKRGASGLFLIKIKLID